MEALLLGGKADLGIKIPPDFSDRIRRGDTAPVQILADGSVSNMASIRISYTVMVLDRFNSAMIKELVGRELKYGKLDGGFGPGSTRTSTPSTSSSRGSSPSWSC